MIIENIAVHRLHSQGIAAPRNTTPGDVVAALGAIQGQDYSGAKWSVGLRLPGSTDAAIEQAIADTTLVRTWVMRGTLHLVAAADLRWLIGLFGPRIIAGSARRYRELELDEPTMARSNELLAEALADGKRSSRTDLLAMLEGHGVSTKGQRGPYLLARASYDGLICQSVAPRNTPTYLSIDPLPKSGPIERDEAVAELARRYITSRGPVTLQDFVGWSGLPVGEARRAFAAVESQFVRQTIGEQSYWMSQDAPEKDDASSGVYLLPGFDEYLLGYRDRSAILDRQYANRIVPGGNGIFYSTIVSHGRVVGTWKRTIKKERIIIAMEPFESLSRSEFDGIQTAAAWYGRFMHMPVVVEAAE